MRGCRPPNSAYSSNGRSNSVESTICGLRAGDARVVADALERLLQVRGVARADVDHRARLARDGVGRLDLGVALDGVADLGRRHPPLAVERDERVRRPAEAAGSTWAV